MIHPSCFFFLLHAAHSHSDWQFFLSHQPNQLIVLLDLIRNVILRQHYHKWLILKPSFSIIALLHLFFTSSDKAQEPPMEFNKEVHIHERRDEKRNSPLYLWFWKQLCHSSWQIFFPVFWFCDLSIEPKRRQESFSLKSTREVIITIQFNSNLKYQIFEQKYFTFWT